MTNADLSRVRGVHAILDVAPCREQAIAAARHGNRAAFDTLLDGISRALTLYQGRRDSLDALAALAPWLIDEWLSAARAKIEADKPNTSALARLVAALPDLAAFQRFRARAVGLTPLARDVLARIRPLADMLDATTPTALARQVERIVKREARLGYRERLEAEAPMLAADAAETTRLVQSLAEAERQLKAINREALVGNIDGGRLGSSAHWQPITRYSGPQALRLREFLERGRDLGLMELRPVWLMNPDVASQLLPIDRAALFDTIVFDEASQMPVEYALPALYRGRTVVVSGDEKQLPPTSFFATRSADDNGDGKDDGFEDQMDEEQQRSAEEAWNRREIQHCSNLLDLSKVVLPSEQLQVHYRSEFRELISFSNAAFYGGNLNVPVRHPEAEVDRHRPLEVVHVDGLYQNRTNAEEADAVVSRLAEIWLGSDTPPTTGVVTFNRDQADFIEERLEARAEADEAFREAYLRETRRDVNGEDVGFFVKNVENVQGDERDHILFSTTFGRTDKGTFRRNFGALGQSGGERRLNVAVTRARRRITIFTSMPLDRIADVLGSGAAPTQPRDYLQLYLAYADAMSRADHAIARRLLAQVGVGRSGRKQATASEGDGFLRSVAEAIRSIGYTPVHAGDDSAFSVDLAIAHPTNGGFGIGIECDSADHPLLVRPHAREVWRPKVMQRSIPALHRITCRGWYQDRAGEIARLKVAIQAALASATVVRCSAANERKAS